MNRFLCPGFSLLHQADTENQQTQGLVGAQLQLLGKERRGAAQPLAHHSCQVMLGHVGRLIKLFRITWQGVVKCTTQNEYVSQVTCFQPLLLRTSFSDNGGKLKKRRNAACLRLKL